MSSRNKMMPKEINRHRIGRYRDDWKLIDFCTVCGAEELQLLQSECQGAMAMQQPSEKFISGLPDDS